MRRRHAPNIHIRLQHPVIRNSEDLLDFGFNGGKHIHVLQVGAEAFELDGSPDEDLEHTFERWLVWVRNLDGWDGAGKYHWRARSIGGT